MLDSASAGAPSDVELTFSPTNDRLAMRASYWRSARVFDLDRERRIPIRLPAGRDVSSTDVAFSPDGSLVALAFDEVAIVYRTNDGSRVRVITAHASASGEGNLVSVTFSPDGRLLLTRRSDNTLRVWNAATGSELYTLRASGEPVFSPDSAVFATDVEPEDAFFGDDYESDAVVWSATSGRRLATVPGNALGFNRDGTRLITIDEGTLRLFGCDGCGSLERLRALAGRRLGKR